MKKIATLLFVAMTLLCLPQPTHAATDPSIISGDTITVIRDVTESSYSFNYTVTAASNELLFCFILDNGSGANFSSATYNGVAMTKVNNNTGTWPSSNYIYLVAPATGLNTLALTFAGNYGHAFFTCVTVKDVDQTTPIDASQFAADNLGGTSFTTSITTVTDHTLLLMGAIINGDGTSITDNGGQTRIAGLDNNNTQHGYSAYKNTTTAGSYSMGLSWTGGQNNDDWVVSLKLAAGGGGGAAASPGYISTD